MSGPMGGHQLGGMDLEHLAATAKVASVETLLIKRELVGQMVAEIQRLRPIEEAARALVAALDAHPIGEYGDAVCEVIDELDKLLKGEDGT